MTPTARPEPPPEVKELHEEVHQFVGNMSNIAAERDSLRVENSTLKNRNEVVEAVAVELKALLSYERQEHTKTMDALTKERDSYMRQALALTTGIMDMWGLVNSVHDTAVAAAKAPVVDTPSESAG